MDIPLVLILLLLSGFFSGSESALFSIRWWRVNFLRTRGDRNGRRLAELLDHPGSLLMTVLLGNTVVNVAASAVFEHWLEQHYPEQALFLAIVVMTAIILVFCEITPKTVAVLKPEKFGLLAATPIRLLIKGLFPARFIADKLSVSLSDKLKPQATKTGASDFLTLVDEGRKADVLTETEYDFMTRILEIGETQVTDVMVPRTEIIALPDSIDFDHAVDAVVYYNFKRIPLYGDTRDNITGILYAKDLLGGKMNPVLKRPPKVLARSPLFVPGHITLKQLSHEFTDKKRHMAIVLDEYGGTAGMITHDDLLQSMFGITDANDKDGFVLERLSNGEILIDARVDLPKLAEIIATALNNSSSRTLNGYLLDYFGRIPEPGESMIVTGKSETGPDWKITIETAAANKVQTVRLTPLTPEQHHHETDSNNHLKKSLGVNNDDE